jgi:multisubunit Na+/H+ antiporter MnhG subunit
LRGGVKVDVVSFGAGAIVAAVGALVLLESSGAVDLTLGWMAVVLTAAVGTILLLSGLADNGTSRHD